MQGGSFHQSLLASDDFATYSLRSSFFVRQLRAVNLWSAVKEVERLAEVSHGFTWSARAQWGIDELAWGRAGQWGLEPLKLFCHPRVLAEQPRLLLYYRTMALLSRKGLASLVGGEVARIEAGGVDAIKEDFLHRLVVALNSIVSAMISAAAELADHQLPGLQFAAAGATIQGSWNNAIGAEGEAAVRTVLVRRLEKEIVQAVWRDGSTSFFHEIGLTGLIDRVSDLRVLRLTHGYHLKFASEPDASLRDAADVPQVAIEVKAGSDPAGALERLGAAMKSFENDCSANPRVKTVYVVRCMTPELRKRIDETRPFDYTFSLAELLADDRTQRTFANLLVRTVVEPRPGPGGAAPT